MTFPPLCLSQCTCVCVCVCKCAWSTPLLVSQKLAAKTADIFIKHIQPTCIPSLVPISTPSFFHMQYTYYMRKKAGSGDWERGQCIPTIYPRNYAFRRFSLICLRLYMHAHQELGSLSQYQRQHDPSYLSVRLKVHPGVAPALHLFPLLLSVYSKM